MSFVITILVPMSIGTKSQKMLWGRAAGRCSMADCRLNLYHDETETDDPTLIGENCHIVAESDEGPRADPTMPVDQRNLYANLILLCRNHHKIIDAQENEYTIAKLIQIKHEHEKWVSQQLEFDPAKQKDDEVYAGYIEKWEALAHVDEWLNWSSSILSHGQPKISNRVNADLSDLRTWLLNRVWPSRYPELEKAFHNFRLVLSDFQETFKSRAVSFGDDMMITEKFYRIDDWNEELYARLARQYDFHVDLTEDLMLELSRAANLICDRVRESILSSYRINEGRLVVLTGPNSDLKWNEMVVQYSMNERGKERPYPGLSKFMIERSERDMHFGSGTESSL